MTLGSRLLLPLAMLPLCAPIALGQPASGQDPSLDNLVHEKDYVTAPPGALGRAEVTAPLTL
jgi:hypothetical protein